MKMRAILVSALFPLLVAVGPYNADPGRYKAPSGHSETGPVAYGFALSLTSDQSATRLGQPIWVTLEIRNVANKMQYASTLARGDGTYQFSIVDRETHRAALVNQHSLFGLDVIGGPLPGRPVPANTSVYLRFDLNEMYRVTNAGKYTVRLERSRLKINGRWYAMPPSNEIQVTIL